MTAKDFDVNKTVDYWREGADYDFGVAEAMYTTRKFPYALFMGHLALEKLLKALVVKRTERHAPITHSLPLLVEKADVAMPEPLLIRLREFMEFHLEARYPDDQRSFYVKCTESYAKVKLDEIKEVFAWLKERI